MHRWSILITVQQDTTQSSLFIILQVHSTCSWCQPHPSSGVHKTITTAFGTGHKFCTATSLQRGQASLATLEGGSWPVPEAVVTVLCTPDDGCGVCVVFHFILVLVIFFVQLSPSNVATLEEGSCTVPEAEVTVLCTPDDGCGWHPKQIEWTCRIINRLLCVVSRWTIINTNLILCPTNVNLHMRIAFKKGRGWSEQSAYNRKTSTHMTDNV